MNLEFIIQSTSHHPRLWSLGKDSTAIYTGNTHVTRIEQTGVYRRRSSLVFGSPWIEYNGWGPSWLSQSILDKFRQSSKLTARIFFKISLLRKQGSPYLWGLWEWIWRKWLLWVLILIILMKVTFYLTILLQFFVGLRLLFKFLDLLHSRQDSLNGGIMPSQGFYLHTGQHKYRTNSHRYPCVEWDSNPRSQWSSRRKLFMP
jgi:hypothetical protein